MAKIISFPPITAPDTRVLILGSMPSEESLQKSQYYAKQQNVFWRILGELIGAGRDVEYAERIEMLKSHGISLWDVMQSCERRGSLDSAIEESSIRPNKLAEFYAKHPGITHVFFNGTKAEAAYRRYIMPQLEQSCAHLLYERLPSTSPANASISYPEKLQAWRKILLNP